MSEIKIRDLSPDLTFGAVVDGANFENLRDPAVRARLNELFEDRALVIFENVEPSGAMHLAACRS